MMGAPMEVVAPILGTSSLVNAKYISTDPMGLTQCPFVNNLGGLNMAYNVNASQLNNFSFPSISSANSGASSTFYNYFNKDLCISGYYKLGASESKTENAAMVYPNPCSDALHLNLSSYGSENVNVELLDITGKHIATVYTGTAKEKIDYQLPQGLSKGLYMLSIQASNGDKRIEKISVQ